MLGQELVDLSFITEKLEEDNVPERLGCGDWVRFAASAWSDTDIEVEAGVWMAGELLPVLACYVGNVRATSPSGTVNFLWMTFIWTYGSK